ncbi:MAG: FAD binding domain-containing protein [Jiangellaceae bacterium]
MEFLQPLTWADALAAKAGRPDAVPLAGGTDVMVEVNFDRSRPKALLDLTRVYELAEWGHEGDHIRLGAGVPYTRVITELGQWLPGLAKASRTVGSPQIRNRGTVGGNLGSASPAGDAHPPLLAAGATVEVESTRGVRRIPVTDFFTGVKRNALEPDELIRAILIRSAVGPQEFSKIGTRNAMVIAVSSFGLALFPEERRVGTGIGSAAPTPRAAPEAETFAAEALDWAGRRAMADDVGRRFGELVAAAAQPIDDVRGTAAYRLHTLSVMARRTLGWAWRAYRTA